MADRPIVRSPDDSIVDDPMTRSADHPIPTYSTRLRTAVVLTGTGTGGAYHAGVLKALAEAGVKIDLVAGRGVGAVSAFFAAVDGGARLWDATGLWRSPGVSNGYGLRPALRSAAWAFATAGAVLAVPLILLAVAVVIGLVGLLLTLVGLERYGVVLTTGYGRWILFLFAPAALPTIIPRLVLFAILIGIGALAAGAAVALARGRGKRRTQSGLAGRLAGSPLSATSIVRRGAAELWNLIRGVAPIAAPPPRQLARKYVELLSDNLGQPGFRDLLVTVHDMDARRDLVFALLSPAARERFFSHAAAGQGGRALELFDLAGVDRDHALDAFAAALALPVAVEPQLTTFAPEGPWRGETHRLCDRPSGLLRLLEEAAAAGAEQIVLVAPLPPPAQAHEMRAGRADLRGRAGEQLASFEAAGLRDVLEHWEGRATGLFVIRPDHNPLGPLDFAGAYDERSDRTHTLGELVDRGYEDAYRQFIEPIVGAG
jgi:hypothetical protein